MFLPRRPMPPMNRYQMNPFGFQPQQYMNQSQKRGLGGLLQRLLPGSVRKGTQGMQGMQGFMNPAGFQQRVSPGILQGMNPSTLQNLANPSNLSAILGNVQKTLKAAETVVPMVQQYGPLVKNIPAMWKIYKELKSSGNDSDSDESTESTESAEETIEIENKNDDSKKKPSSPKKRTTGESLPKLYI